MLLARLGGRKIIKWILELQSATVNLSCACNIVALVPTNRCSIFASFSLSLFHFVETIFKSTYETSWFKLFINAKEFTNDRNRRKKRCQFSHGILSIAFSTIARNTLSFSDADLNYSLIFSFDSFLVVELNQLWPNSERFIRVQCFIWSIFS